MNDKRIEDILKQSWNPEPNDGMRERVLSRAKEIAGRKRMPLIFRQWKTAFAVVGLAIVIFTNVSDNARQDRMTAIMGGSNEINVPFYKKRLLELRDLQAQVPDDGWLVLRGVTQDELERQ